jgi:uncharacterized protein with NRDE domain
VRALLAVIASAVVLSNCTQMIAQQALKDAREKFAKCVADNNATPEGRMITACLWRGDGSDTAAKLSDPNPLTPAERNALVQVHNRGLQCRQFLDAYDSQYAAWATPYAQAMHQRSDQIFYKLASGELPVGLANRLYIESNGQFQVDLSRGHADAVRDEEAQRQRAAEAMLQANALAAAQPRSQVPQIQTPQMTTTNCTWLGNTLNCTSMR